MHIKTKMFIIPTLLASSIIAFMTSASSNATSVAEKIHFIKNTDFGGDAIVIESNGHFGLIDTMSAKKNSTVEDSFEGIKKEYAWTFDNGETVRNYLTAIGCETLDFVVITHSHSDHIGGFPEIQKLIKDNTTVFYKEPAEDSKENGNYKNYDYYQAMMKLLSDKQENKCDVSKTINGNNCKTGNDKLKIKKEYVYAPNNISKLKDRITFKFEDLSIALYNLSRITKDDENNNSIATLVTKEKGPSVMLMGDLEAKAYDENGKEIKNGKGIENQIADMVGNVSILKAGHHGHGDYSNSTYMLDKFNPSTYVITRPFKSNTSSPQDDTIAPILYLYKNRALSYYTNQAGNSQSSGAIVAEFIKSGEATSYIMKNYIVNGNGGITVANSLLPIYDNIQDTNLSPLIEGPAVSSRKWHSIRNKKIENNATGWQKFGDLWYYFTDTNGVAYTGWHKSGNYWYYLTDSGAMATGWEKIDGTWYYFNSNGAMATGWIKDNGYWYYLNSNGAMATGWIKDNGYWYYLTDNGAMVSDIEKTIDGKKYKFDGTGRCLNP